MTMVSLLLYMALCYFSIYMLHCFANESFPPNENELLRPTQDITSGSSFSGLEGGQVCLPVVFTGPINTPKYVCMYVCMYICMCVHMYVHVLYVLYVLLTSYTAILPLSLSVCLSDE